MPKVTSQAVPVRERKAAQKAAVPARTQTHAPSKVAQAREQSAVQISASERPSVGAAVPVKNEQTPSPRAARMHFVHVPGALAEVMLPATGSSETASFTKWAKALERADVFGTQRTEVAALAKLQTGKGDAGQPHRPRIGILVHNPAELLQPEKLDLKNFVAAVKAIGAEPVFIPPMAELGLPDDPIAREQAMAGMLNQLDGLIGPGGQDLHPRLYREPITGAERENINYPRDEFEARLLKHARDEMLFTLGVCRSHQLLNVVGGGTLVQDMLSEGQVSRNHRMEELGEDRSQVLRWETPTGVAEHEVQASGELAQVTGKQLLETNSLHHQSADGAAPDAEVVGITHDPGTGRDVVEATRRWNMLSLQFHPEYRPDEPESQALLGMLRRSWAFFFEDQLRHEGVKPTANEIARRLDAAKIELTDVDKRWLHEELSAHL